ncbi:MAG: hypothetical protein ACJ78Q_02310 [Chloroflexia bacterium]
MTMTGNSDDSEFFSVEDLDPEPSPRGGWTNAREFMVGGLLLLAVLGWAGWSWWQQQARQNNYQMAQQAAANRDWDRARAYYQATEGYKDSNAQVAQIGKLITERDSWYTQATAGASKGEWVAALNAAEQVINVQPHYQETERLQKESQAHIYKEVLQGAVALRTQAEPAGLYYRDAERWQWLDRSDRYSALRASGPGDRIVYDIPGKGWTPDRSTGATPTPTPQLGEITPGSVDLEGRLLVMASLRDGQVSTATLNLDPARYNFYVLGDQGMWAVRWIVDTEYHEPSRLRTSYNTWSEISYLSFSSPTTSTLRLPGDKWEVTDLASDGRHVLLADYTHLHDLTPMTYLYISNGDGSDRHLLYSYPGGIDSAQFSLDSAYVLVTTYNALPILGTENGTAVLIDAAGKDTPRVLASGLMVPGRGYNPEPAVGGAFLRNGPFAGRLLLGNWTDTSATMTLLDPARPQGYLIRGTIDAATWGDPTARPVPPGIIWVGHQRNDTLLLGWPNRGTGDSGSTGQDNMSVIIMSGDNPPKTTSLPIDRGMSLFSTSSTEDYLAYGTLTWNGGVGVTLGLYTIPLSGLEGEQVKATTIYSGTLDDVSPFVSIPWVWRLGAHTIAYASGGVLHATTYKGDTTVTLEQGVDKLYDPDRSEELYWLR